MLAVVLSHADLIGIFKCDKAMLAAGIVCQGIRFLLGSAVVSENSANDELR